MLLSGNVNAFVVQQFNHTGRSARQEGEITNHDFTHVHRMERIHVLVGVDVLDDHLFIQALRQWGLHQNAVDFRALIQLLYQSQQLLLGGGRRQRILLGVETYPLASLLFIVYIGAGSRIVAHNDNC